MNGESKNGILAEPGVPTIRQVNWRGLWTLYVKEVRRFFKVQLQTVWAPALTTMLFLLIFTVSLSGAKPQVLGVPFADFIAPGLIIMGMMQAAFAHSSFSLMVGKIQGTIVDYLMPPLSTGELLFGLAGSGVTRAVCVGGAVWLGMALWPEVDVAPAHPWAIAFFGIAGATMLALMGVLTSIWAEKFDHAAVISNFVVAPLSLLSGTFYSVDRLAPAFQAISHVNPFHYAISGFRYGFIGVADIPLWQGVTVLVGVDLFLGLLCYRLIKLGWKLKN